MSYNRTLARKRRSELEYGKEKVDSTVKKGRFQGGEEGQAKKISLREVEEKISR